MLFPQQCPLSLESTAHANSIRVYLSWTRQEPEGGPLGLVGTFHNTRCSILVDTTGVIKAALYGQTGPNWLDTADRRSAVAA